MMFRDRKTLFYFNQYFVIRLGEKIYKFDSKIESFPLIRSLFTLLFHAAKLLFKRQDTSIKKKYRHIVFIETINQKNAILDVFNFMQNDREEVLFIVNNGITIDGFDNLQFNNRKAFLLGLFYWPKACCVSLRYTQRNKGIINRVHVLVNLSLFLSSEKIFNRYIEKTGAQKIILTNDHNLQPLALLLSAKRKQVKSYYIQHASVSSAFPKLLPDVSLLEGQQAIDTYNQIGNYSREIKLVGIARLDGILAYKKEYRTKDITVGFCLKPYYSLELIREIIEAIKASNNVAEVILRPHPGNSAKFYRSLEQFNVSISNAKKERPHEFIKRIDVMISGESSIILEASLMKTKTIYIDDKIAQLDLYGFIKNRITTFAQNLREITQMLDTMDASQIESQYANCGYYCSTVNTPFENKSRELILNNLLYNDK
ncbi:hypothetical protein [Flavobacterium terrisoli]|uniref:hypothetical protein n=1 Tax=Flavobacterium terrisoli TaxID=3242195 RepID=UPI002543CB31|nr:hypothetical protein [Flavobacterium buctense]